jgi:hypothetical protein
MGESSGQNDSGGNDRASERPPAHFVQSGNAFKPAAIRFLLYHTEANGPTELFRQWHLAVAHGRSFLAENREQLQINLSHGRSTFGIRVGQRAKITINKRGYLRCAGP